ncbi:MAG: hypothetical protein HY847_14775 [Betaproteobacteria bacterium]|nr:hypothetical protein [Betaproteobacteria bacterium]
MAAEFRDFYGRTLDLLPGVMHEGQFTGGWLEAMVRKHRKANHPLHHLLLQDFLAQQETHKSPFGNGPWACRNPLANHSSSLIIKKVEVHRNRGNSVGVFACTCGYTYTRCFSPSQQKLGPPRFLRYGPLLESELRRLVAGGIGLRQTAHQLKLDPKTVMRLSHELNVSVPWTLKPSGYGRKRPKEETQSRSKPERTDSGPKCSKVKSARYDWPLIDQSIVRGLMTMVKDIKAMNPPVRVTLAELERRNGRRGWLSKRRHRLPLTSRRLDRMVESVEQFQLRRIHWAIAEIQSSGGPTKAWKVMRMAGLRSDSLRRIEAVLSDAPYRWRAAA